MSKKSNKAKSARITAVKKKKPCKPANDVNKKLIANIGKTTAITFSFDTTGSMSNCIMQVRQKLRDLVEQMTADIPGLKIGLIAHGDYCDAPNTISVLDLTDDVTKIMKFITDVPNTSGGDAPECYELVLNRARMMSWPAEGGSLVLIGDATPHEPNDPQNTDRLDWRHEIAALKEMNISVLPLQCMGAPHRTEENNFWEGVSAAADTPLLLLDNFQESSDTLSSVVYATAGEEAYSGYMTRRCADKSLGLCSMNFMENSAKLAAFASTKNNTTAE